jgi:hypothetical protein
MRFNPRQPFIMSRSIDIYSYVVDVHFDFNYVFV